MGNKFCNLNIYRTAPVELTAEVPQSHTYQCADQWLTVTSPVLEWGNTQKYAKALSKKLSCPVLSTEYFDDDFVEFSLYCCGKLITKHIPVAYEDIKKKKGNAAKMMECLSRNRMEEAALKKVLSVSDCEESVYLLESYLGCPIFGITDECPPIHAPDRTLFHSFAGGKSNVAVKLQQNHARASEPPYAMELDSVFVEKTVLHETVICFTDKPEPILRKIELWLKRLREDREQGFYGGVRSGDDVLKEYDIRVFLKKNRVIIQGLNYGARWVDDLSREFKSLTFVSDMAANGFLRVWECAMGYEGKCLFRGVRGTKGALEPEVMPNVLLESPFLTLLDGELVAGFEAENRKEAVSSFEKLLDAPIRPINPEQAKRIKSADHLQVFTIE